VRRWYTFVANRQQAGWRGSRGLPIVEERTMRKFRLVAISGLVLLTATATATALAAAAPSGNRQGIAFARAQQRAYTKVRAVSYTQTGFVAIRDAKRAGRRS
jgi:heme/copper-type cytochrome/quinol oxidase subunit 3